MSPVVLKAKWKTVEYFQRGVLSVYFAAYGSLEGFFVSAGFGDHPTSFMYNSYTTTHAQFELIGAEAQINRIPGITATRKCCYSFFRPISPAQPVLISASLHTIHGRCDSQYSTSLVLLSYRLEDNRGNPKKHTVPYMYSQALYADRVLVQNVNQKVSRFLKST